MKRSEKLYIVMPAYNEEDNIESVVKQWYPILKFGSKESKLVIADAGSVDKTHNILISLKKKYPQLEIVSKSLKQHGPKVIYLYKYAINNNADWIFQTDSDGQTNPEEFEEFWNLRNKYDVILGNRTVRGDGKSRAFVEKVVCFLLKLYFGVKVRDANAPFRLMKSNVVNKYINNFKEDYNLPNIMMTTYFSYYKENLVFREITFKPRQGGVNSMNIPKIVKIGWKALSDFRVFKGEMENNEFKKTL
jgi:glycosyltransferase involved in cell wall biosynthesis